MKNHKEIDRRYLLRKYNDSKIMLVSDLHLGFEGEWVRHGLKTRELSWSFEIIDRLRNDIRNTNAECIFFLGDIEHSFGHYKGSRDEVWVSDQWQNERIESYLLKQIFSIDGVEFHLIRGNQDTSLIKSLEKYSTIIPSKGIALFKNQLGITHGNVYPTAEVILASEIVLGHVHPAIELVDELNVKYRLPVFAKLKIPREEAFRIFKFDLELEEIGLVDLVQITILPTYNNFLSGFALNKKQQNKSRESSFPVVNTLIQHPKLELQMTNGVVLGFLEDLYI
jgi:metallophosphoesterase superfamily enzyme